MVSCFLGDESLFGNKGVYNMQFDKFTIKAQEAIQESQNITGKYDHQQIEPEHILMALLLQQDGIVVPILQKLGVDSAVLIKKVEESISSRKNSTLVNSGGWLIQPLFYFVR